MIRSVVVLLFVCLYPGWGSAVLEQSALSEDGKMRLRGLLKSAEAQGIPAAWLEKKIAEGLAKQKPEEMIVRAVEQRLENIKQSQAQHRTHGFDKALLENEKKMPLKDTVINPSTTAIAEEPENQKVEIKSEEKMEHIQSQAADKMEKIEEKMDRSEQLIEKKQDMLEKKMRALEKKHDRKLNKRNNKNF